MTFFREGFAIDDWKAPDYLWDRVQDQTAGHSHGPDTEMCGFWKLADERYTASDVFYLLGRGFMAGDLGMLLIDEAVREDPARVAELFGYGWMPDAEYEAREQAEADAIGEGCRCSSMRAGGAGTPTGPRGARGTMTRRSCGPWPSASLTACADPSGRRA